MNTIKKCIALAVIINLISTSLPVPGYAADFREQGTAFSRDMSFVSFDAVKATSMDLFSGRATTSVPLSVPPARKGFSPEIGLTYTSGNGNGIVGVGWSFPEIAIERSTRKGPPSYTENDTYMLLFGGSAHELIKINATDYRVKTEGAFLKIVRNPSSWTLYDPSGTQYTLGASSPAQRITNRGIFAWHVERIQDVNGNYMTYTYESSDGALYITAILYNGHTSGILPTHRITFTYEARPDEIVSYMSGSKMHIKKRLKSVSTYVSTVHARSYEFGYSQSASKKSLLVSVTERGRDGVSTLNPITFSYTESSCAFSQKSYIQNVKNTYGDASYQYMRYLPNDIITTCTLLDINGDGLLDRIMKRSSDATSWMVQLMDKSGTTFKTPQPWGTPRLSANTNCNYVGYHTTDAVISRLQDITGDGMADRIYNEAGGTAWCVQKNTGNELSPQTDTWTVYDGTQAYDQYIQYRNASLGTSAGDLIDMNADGYPDRLLRISATEWKIQYGTGTSFKTLESWPGAADGAERLTYLAGSGQINTVTVVDSSLIDMNGDQLPDRVMCMGADWKIQFNNGRGFEAPVVWPGIEGSGAYAYIRAIENQFIKTELLDMNGDNLPDRILSTSPSGVWQVQLNTGTSFLRSVPWENIDTCGNNTFYYVGYETDERRVPHGLYDINGDGLPDRIMHEVSTNLTWTVQLQSGALPELLKEVNNGKGGKTVFSYTPSTRYDNTDAGVPQLGFPVHTVSSITQSDACGRSFTTRIEYSKGKFDRASREFRGFGVVTTTDPYGTKTIQSFHQDPVYQGKLYKTEVYDKENKPLYKKSTAWNQTQLFPGVTFVFPEHIDEYTYHPNGTYRRQRVSCMYDAYGNVITKEEKGEYYTHAEDGRSDIGLDERVTTNEYGVNTAAWILHTPKRQVIESSRGEKVQELMFFYDGASTPGAMPVKGNCTKEERWHKEGAPVINERAYDIYGNQVRTIDGRGFVSDTEYDSVYHQFPVRVTNPVGHTTRYTYDTVMGLILSVTDPNGACTETAYDSFGRIVRVIEPGDSSAYPTKVISYRSYQSPTQVERVRTDLRELSGTGKVFTTFVFYDGLGRVLETRVECEKSGMQIVTGHTTLTCAGQVERAFVPSYEAYAEECGAPDTTKPCVTMSYDALGRVIMRTAPDGSIHETVYEGWNVWSKTYTSAHMNEKKTCAIHDAYGNIIRVAEYTGDAVYSETNYTYDTVGRLVKTCDSLGSVTQVSYDSLGRKICLDDQDTGKTQFEYDANGNLVTETDSRGVVCTMTYDGLNRMTEKKYSDGMNGVRNVYDEHANGIGRMSSMTGDTMSTSYTYDARGRVIKEDVTIQGVVYTYKRAYDALGRLTEVTYPDARSVVYAYHDGGGVSRIGLKVLSTLDDDFFVKSVSYNAHGEMIEIVYGNGVRTSYAHDPVSFRIKQVETRNLRNEILQNFLYAFDNNGNVLGITDRVYTGTQQFQYDHLNRLTRAEGAYGTMSYAYDQVGNMTQQKTVRGQLTATTTFHYGEAPYSAHQLTSLSSGMKFRYDEAGNMTERWKEVSGEERTEYLTLLPGWNKITFSVLPEEKSVLSLFASLRCGIDYDQVSCRDEVSGSWKHFVNLPLFNDFETCTYGSSHSYYVFMKTTLPVTLAIEGQSEPVIANHEVLTYDSTGSLSRMQARIPEVYEHTYQFSEGWNVVSFPYLPVDKSVASLCKELVYGVDYDQISYYDAEKRAWNHYVGDSTINDFSSVFQGVSYWIYVKRPGVSMTVRGVCRDKDAVFRCVKGVNYCGAISGRSERIDTWLAGVPYTRVMKCNATTQAWGNVDGAALVEPGVGYRIEIDQDEVITFKADEMKRTETAFRYSPSGMRCEKRSDESTVRYVGGGYEERTENGSVTRLMHVYLGDMRIAEMRNGTEVRFIHGDHINSCHVITDATGAVVELYEYTPFGETSREERVDQEGSGTQYKFTGQEEDVSTGLYYYHARYYDPKLCRFIQADSVVQSPYDAQTLNRYTYCRNNPIVFVDPSGNSFLSKLFDKITGLWGGNKTVTSIIAGGAALGTLMMASSPMLMKVSAGLTLGSIGASYVPGEAASNVSKWLGTAAAGVATLHTASRVAVGLYDWGFGKGMLMGGGSEIVDYSDIFTKYDGGLFVNGIMTSVNSALGTASKHGIALFYNPTHGFIADIVECALQKTLFTSSIDRQFGGILNALSSPIKILAHSQGTLLSSNALLNAALRGNGLPEGSRIKYIGPAISKIRGALAAKMSGARSEHRVHFLDPVNLVAMNENPLNFVGGAVGLVMKGTKEHAIDTYTQGRG